VPNTSFNLIFSSQIWIVHRKGITKLFGKFEAERLPLTWESCSNLKSITSCKEKQLNVRLNIKNDININKYHRHVYKCENYYVCQCLRNTHKNRHVQLNI